MMCVKKKSPWRHHVFKVEDVNRKLCQRPHGSLQVFNSRRAEKHKRRKNRSCLVEPEPDGVDVRREAGGHSLLDFPLPPSFVRVRVRDDALWKR